MARPVPPRRFLPGLLFLVAACSGRSPSPAAAPAPAAGPGTNGASLAHAMTVPALEGYELAVNRGTRSRSGAPGPRYWQQWADYKLEAELNPVSKRMTGKGTIKLPEPLARHPPDRLHPVAAEHFRARGPAQHRRPVGRGGGRAEPGGRAGNRAPRRHRRCGRIRGQRHDHAPPAAQAAGAGRHRGLRPRLEAQGAPRRRPARRPGRRGVLHELLVSADGGVRRRQRVADRPVPRPRRVLHGVRQLRREPDGSGRLAGDGHGDAAEPGRRADRPDPRAARRPRGPTPASFTWSPISIGSPGAPPPPARTASSPGASGRRTCAT